jgi:hypothetical protein
MGIWFPTRDSLISDPGRESSVQPIHSRALEDSPEDEDYLVGLSLTRESPVHILLSPSTGLHTTFTKHHTSRSKDSCRSVASTKTIIDTRTVQ